MFKWSESRLPYLYLKVRNQFRKTLDNSQRLSLITTSYDFHLRLYPWQRKQYAFLNMLEWWYMLSLFFLGQQQNNIIMMPMQDSPSLFLLLTSVVTNLFPEYSGLLLHPSFRSLNMEPKTYFLIFCFVYLFFDRVSYCIPGWFWTH